MFINPFSIRIFSIWTVNLEVPISPPPKKKKHLMNILLIKVYCTIAGYKYMSKYL